VSHGTKRKRLLVLLGNRLFPIEEIKEAGADVIFMAESEKRCHSYRAHRHKLVLFLGHSLGRQTCDFTAFLRQRSQRLE